MLSLSQFSHAALLANSLKVSDIQISMSLGENYAKKLHSFVNQCFTVKDFSCNDNGLAKKLSIVTEDNDSISIEIVTDAFKSNAINISGSMTEAFSGCYSDFESFSQLLNQMKDTYANQTNQRIS